MADDSPGGVAGATERTAATITRNGATLGILEPLPDATFDPTVCLSGAATVGECAYEPPASPSATEVVYRALDHASDDVVSVDLDPLVCPAIEVCVPVLDEMLVFRNQFHVSNALLLDRADRIWTTMEQAGAFDRVG